ncbi:hypothetical protein, partial [Pseudoalteromonas sp. SG44-4]|uniref:hypothetical protein n=1 Tax=Pseudoalteromonas sp. SG44-4 TaxID=2760961 RepID=UPI001C71A498
LRPSRQQAVRLQVWRRSLMRCRRRACSREKRQLLVYMLLQAAPFIFLWALPITPASCASTSRLICCRRKACSR